MMQGGYSRDHRPDCKQLVIALVVNIEAFPLSYETFRVAVGASREARPYRDQPKNMEAATADACF